MGYLFFDTETTGVDPLLDQIIEYYGAYTERVTAMPHSDLKVVDKMGPLRCRLMPGRLPDPFALRVNNINLAEINRAPMSVYEMTGLIESRTDNYSRDERLFTSAYNLPFDEKMIRMANFLCLRAPGTLRDLSRRRVAFDTLKLVRAATRLDPDAYKIPAHDTNKSKITFKQGLFARLNGLHFPPSYEHSAKHDVEDGTFAIASMIRDKSPNIWDLMVQTADTPMLVSQIRKNMNDIYVHINTTGNEREMTHCSIIGFRQAKENSKRVSPHLLVWDLAHDPDEAADATDADWDKWYEDAAALPPRPSPLKVIDLRNDHFFVPRDRLKTAPGLKPPKRLTQKELARRHDAAQELPRDKTGPLVGRLTERMAFPTPPEGSPIERYLFARDQEPDITTDLSEFVIKGKRTRLSRVLSQFHTCDDWHERAKLLPELKLLSPHVYERALYLVGEHCFEALDYYSGDAERYVEKLNRDLTSPDSPYRTFDQVIEKAAALRDAGTRDDKRFYGSMIDELERMRKAHTAFMKTWDKVHMVAPERETTLFSGRTTAQPGIITNIKVA